jgi:hypothetical protein
MRLIVLILLLFTGSITPALCTAQTSYVDSTKHVVKKQIIKHHLRADRPKPILPEDKLYYRDCVFTHKYSIAQRLKKYPFSKAVKVLAVSYNNGLPNPDVIIVKDKTKKPKTKPFGRLRIHIHNDTLDHTSLFEFKQLTARQVNRLTNMIFNTDIKVHHNLDEYVATESMCFEPRNAFVFIDKNGKVFDYVEVCLQCKGTESESRKINIENCNQSLDMTKKFLIDLGIKFGTLTINTADMNQ